jgi:polysaccharide biosynthesis transport protein
LYTNLKLALASAQPHALVLFSAGPGEGKSTTLHRLARLMGASGEKVILVDSDLRRPTQHRLAETTREPGLSEVLLAQRSVEEVVQRGISPGLDFIASGAASGFSLSMIYGQRLRELIATLKGRYDWVMFDSPPVIGVSDASVLASAVDGAVLLVQHRRNPQSMVLRAQQIVAALKTPLVGVVLNHVPLNAGGEYAYYTNNYAYYGAPGKSADASARGGPTRAGSDGLDGREVERRTSDADVMATKTPRPTTAAKDRVTLREPDRR